MALTHRRSRGRYVVAVLLLASLTLITLDARGGGALRSARNATQSVLSPIESGIHDALRPVGNFFAGAADYGSQKAELARLRTEIANDQANAAQLQYEEQQVQQALKQYDLPYTPAIKHLTADVTSQPSSNFDATITIDLGTSSGVVVNQPVVGSAGLIGQVAAAGSRTAQVELLTEPGFSCGVSLTAGNIGIVKGQGVGKELELTVQPDSGKPAQLKKGQEVYTSDLLGSYPAGIPVGKITAVDTDGATTTASVQPSQDTSDLGFVDVMLWSGQ